MGAAAKSYAGVSKARGEPPPGSSWGSEQRPLDTNQYRLKHGLTVMDRTAQMSGEFRVTVMDRADVM